MDSLVRKSLRGIFLLTLISFNALAFQPTAAQLEQFNNLSPEQQTKAMSALKGSGSSAPAPAVVVAEPSVVTPRKPEASKVEAITVESLDKIETQDKKEEKIIRQKLELFGYDLFAGTPSTFAPATDIPIPAEYVIGPGDVINIQFFGNQNGEYQVSVSRDGLLQIPNLPPFSVIGLSFNEMKREIGDRIARQMIGVSANITLGALRSIRIFILGNAHRPGSYTVSSLSTMTNALFVSGGIKKIGSLRNIQLKRNGKLVKTLDLYDLLLKGDTSNDERLLPGDVLFIPPIGDTVGIAGEINRPAIYEITRKSTVNDLLNYAGGTLSTAHLPLSQIERISKSDGRTILDIDLTKTIRYQTPVQDGDTIRIYPIQDTVKNAVTLTGHVTRPGPSQWYRGMRVSDLLPDIENSLLPYPDLEYAIVTHLDRNTSKISVESINLRNAITKWSSPDNLQLKPDDGLIVFSANTSRAGLLSSTINRLKQQATYQDKATIVEILGSVNYPGTYPLTPKMHISDVLTAASELNIDTDLNYSILARYSDDDNTISVIPVDIKQIDENKKSPANILIKPRDRLYVFSKYGDRAGLIDNLLNQLRTQAKLDDRAKIVEVKGAVKKPGFYPLHKEMRVSDIISASAGLETDPDYNYSILARYSEEDNNISVHGIDLMDVINNPDSPSNIKLAKRDRLYIFSRYGDKNNLIEPLLNQIRIQAKLDDRPKVVEIKGAVKKPGFFPLHHEMDISDLLNAASGFNQNPDLDYAILVRYAENDNTISVHPIDLHKILEKENRKSDLKLQARDQLYTFSKYDKRDDLKALLGQLKAQSNLYDPTKIVSITGHVAAPGSVPLTQGMRVKDLIHAGGFFTEQAYQYEGELIRQVVDESGTRTMEQFPINFMMALEGNVDNNLILQPHDSINVKKIPKWNDRREITLTGEVKFPGTYQIQEDETLSSVIKRAGGISESGFVKGAVFMRKSLQAKEQSEINRLHQRLKAEISSYRLGQQGVTSLTTTSTTSIPVQEIEALLNLIDSAKPIGRLVIDLENTLKEESTRVVLHDGDHLHIPKIPQEVTIIGEVNYATSHLYSDGMDVEDFISQSGGVTQLADEEKIYVVRSNGSVVADATSGFFGGYSPEAGDTIIVPQDLERIRPLTYWTSITQILYQLGVAAAAWQTVGAI